MANKKEKVELQRGTEEPTVEKPLGKSWKWILLSQLLKMIVLVGLGVLCAYSIKYFVKYASHQALLAEYPTAPRYFGFCHFHWNPNGNLRTMDRAFNRLGYVDVDALQGEDWDVMWTIEYPFTLTFPELKNMTNVLKPHQIVNHIPGNNVLCNKAVMSTVHRSVPYVLQGFQFPRMIKEFREFTEANPKTRFVEKLHSNRGIKLVEEDEIIYDKSDKVYQVFLEEPLLIDKRAMDFAIYVAISSVDPIRIYRFEQEVHLRFCTDPYYPFNASNVNKYVVSDNRRNIYDMPSLNFYNAQFGYSNKLSIEHYLEKEGHNLTEFWRKIDDAIVQLILDCEGNYKYEVV